MRSMHKKRTEDLVLHEPQSPQLIIKLQDAEEMLTKEASSMNASVGVFGWSDEWLKPVRQYGKGFRNRTKAQATAPEAIIIQTIARLVKLIGEGNAPKPLAWLATTGGLSARRSTRSHSASKYSDRQMA